MRRQDLNGTKRLYAVSTDPTFQLFKLSPQKENAQVQIYDELLICSPLPLLIAICARPANK